ncbi:MAG: TIGR02206 family membrane protein [Propionibacteriaceae bacterium]|nr:TIGR02206 family membrane protein [Propionibacteriaceae bacterium]
MLDFWRLFTIDQYAPLDPSYGFGIFSPAHLGVLAGLALGTAILVYSYRRMNSSNRKRTRLIVGWTALMLEVVRQIVYVALGVYSVEILPLHLCAVTTFFVWLDSVRPNRWSQSFLYSLGSWGALAALLFPDWANRPLLNIFSMQSFLIHALLVAYILMRLVAKEMVPNWRDLWRVLVVLAVIIPISMWLNASYGTNFWFLNAGAPGSPLEPIQSFAGDYYIPFLFFLVLCLWVIMYLPWELAGNKKRIVAELV